MSFDIVGLGLCAWDTICLFDRYPGPNQKVEVKACATSGGGPVPTALAVFSRLGGRASYVGVVGDDVEGEKIRRDLQNYAVDTSHLLIRPGKKTPCAYIWVDGTTGQRTVALNPGDAPSLEAAELPVKLLKSAPLLLIDGRDAGVCYHAATICRQGGGKVILDAGSPREGINRLLAVTDHAVVSDDFASGTFPGQDAEEAVHRIREMGPKAVVMTQGERGGLWLEDHSEDRYSAYRVALLDTTGAGDAFHGAYLYGLKSGWDMDRRCRFASAVAALVCRGLGGRASAPTLKEALSFMQNPIQ